jgi:phosphohistidine swiveling domain-containing protein
MKFWVPLADISDTDRDRVGGKAHSLARLSEHDLRIPRTYCIPVDAYRLFVKQNGLAERIHLELHRKDLAEMRWEEMWDASQRIRHLFLKTPLPEPLAGPLKGAISATFQDTPVAVRSSALGEDTAQASYAGIHESYLNVRGPAAIMRHIRMVWASLWSDAALLYRNELGLDLQSGVMAVVVQEFIPGRVSGIVFSQNPMDRTQGVIEAVSGLNQALVEGKVEPDRWVWNRSGPAGMVYHPSSTGKPPLTPHQLEEVRALSEHTERIFGNPQDTEWTFRKRTLFALQSRPITTDVRPAEQQDTKAWNLSLRRSFENLKELRSRIEGTVIPEMGRETKALSRDALTGLSDEELTREIQRRQSTYEKWKDVYWDVFIPFAHGFRLFGQVYNDRLHPEDPYEFIELLRPTRMESLKRNRMLERMSNLLPESLPKSETRISVAWNDLPPEFAALWQTYHRLYANLPETDPQDPDYRERFLGFLMRSRQQHSRNRRKLSRNRRDLEDRYLNAFSKSDREFAVELLDLARFSYRLRDDDNIFLGRIEQQLHRALSIAQARLKNQWKGLTLPLPMDDVLHALQDPAYRPKPPDRAPAVEIRAQARPRQIKGQPAGKGLASGKARVIRDQQDLFAFQRGEILVCDAIEPNMTFVVPLAAAIVERRGGMLIHGAIIAREYGIPCVTGIPNIADLVNTGNPLTVDGYLGIVVFNSN